MTNKKCDCKCNECKEKKSSDDIDRMFDELFMKVMDKKTVESKLNALGYKMNDASPAVTGSCKIDKNFGLDARLLETFNVNSLYETDETTPKDVYYAQDDEENEDEIEGFLDDDSDIDDDIDGEIDEDNDILKEVDIEDDDTKEFIKERVLDLVEEYFDDNEEFISINKDINTLIKLIEDAENLEHELKDSILDILKDSLDELLDEKNELILDHFFIK